MRYHQITPEETYTLATLRKQTPALSNAAMAALLGRNRSTILREFRRNSGRYDGAYRTSVTKERTNGQRSRSPRNSRFSLDDWKMIAWLLRQLLSLEQPSGRRAAKASDSSVDMLRATSVLQFKVEPRRRYA